MENELDEQTITLIKKNAMEIEGIESVKQIKLRRYVNGKPQIGIVIILNDNLQGQICGEKTRRLREKLLTTGIFSNVLVLAKHE